MTINRKLKGIGKRLPEPKGPDASQDNDAAWLEKMYSYHLTHPASQTREEVLSLSASVFVTRVHSRFFPSLTLCGDFLKDTTRILREIERRTGCADRAAFNPTHRPWARVQFVYTALRNGIATGRMHEPPKVRWRAVYPRD